jgi:tetratricopeptide (TPR) repeat protein
LRGILLLCLVGLGSAHAGENDARRKRARAYYESGLAHFQLDEYGEAAKDFEAGFRLAPRPLFLFNAAQAWKLAGELESAQARYRKFLELGGQLEQREQAESDLAEVEQQLAARHKEAVEVPKVAPAPPAQTTAVAAPAQPARKSRRKGWIVGLVATSAVAAVLAVGLGIGLSQHGQFAADWPSDGQGRGP